jgi:hypothetical protein
MADKKDQYIVKATRKSAGNLSLDVKAIVF